MFSQEEERKVSQPCWIQMGMGTNQGRKGNHDAFVAQGPTGQALP